MNKPVLILACCMSVTLSAVAVINSFAEEGSPVGSKLGAAQFQDDVCPPFQLLDEEGHVIDVLNGVNADQPYSPKQTCGKCHDYEKITQGFHFAQGSGELPTARLAERCQWISSPGNYGGPWCSPAPLYRYLAAKQNDSPSTIDMTSFTFLTEGCGVCHPGGGPAEFDREGKRYDRWMSDPASSLTSGGVNGYDGDYFEARWSETGVMEADCLICHMPEYNMELRNQQIEALNLRWAPSAGAGWATVMGSIKAGQPVQIAYDARKFNSDGTVSPHIVREPRNEACLFCHAKPGWKKRGADFHERGDVHLQAGLKCVDCHPAGSSADDSRISGKDEHQIAKGDDPGGHVRDDLDNTLVTCAGCHSTGRLGAPVATHTGLPPLHLSRIACQTCHIPERTVKAAQVQASDVFNPGTKILSKGKHLWTFYGPDMLYWNHYGELEMMGYSDKPTDRFRPVYTRYKGMIYPVNRVHNTWPALQVDGKLGLMQPKISHIYKMWAGHRQDPLQYPELAKIKDDNGDGVPEVNQPAEIDALIASVTAALQDSDYPMDGTRVVWVMDDRIYTSGTTFTTVGKESWEASPFANTHKYSHGVYPAGAALGTNGCTDCHHEKAGFLFASVVKYPFGPDAKPVMQPQYELLGLSRFQARLGAWRETYLRPIAIWLIGLTFSLLLLHLTIFGIRRLQTVASSADAEAAVRCSLSERLSHLVTMAAFIGLSATAFFFFLGRSNPLGSWAPGFHAWLGWLFVSGVLLIGVNWARSMLFKRKDSLWLKALGGYFGGSSHLPAGKFNAGQKLYFWLVIVLGLTLSVTGVLMFFVRANPDANLVVLYSLHDLAAALLLPIVLAHVYLSVVINPGALGNIFGGAVSREWLVQHHPDWQPGGRADRPHGGV